MTPHGLAHDMTDFAEPSDVSPEPAAPGGGRRLKAADFAAGALLAALSIAVAVNALVLQGPGGGAPVPPRRPAAEAAPDRTKAAKVVAPAPAAAPAPAHPAPVGGATEGSLGYLVMRSTGSPPPAAPGPAPAPRAQAESVRRPLAAVGTAPVPEVTGAVRPPAELPANGRVLSVQKALSRIGYGPIKADGRPGAETRLAIQRFQRDRNLPADGEISDRLVRELAAVTGTAVY
ncbi:peptidoglycan-binding domain-containing protein [Xanthobacter sp. KR7-225]|uniref:peptidoglycan-binding domain-containing protein n=1 Tax=Xanthobacter sp. KR7-225 TaxID=3156613 RepID=UPI0032B45F77